MASPASLVYFLLSQRFAGETACLRLDVLLFPPDSGGDLLAAVLVMRQPYELESGGSLRIFHPPVVNGNCGGRRQVSET